jgi:flagellar protein FliO/FliZ
LDNGTLAAAAAPDLGLAWLKMVGGLFLLLALLFLVLYLVKRLGPRMGLPSLNSRDLSLHAQLALGPKKNVVVVRFLNKFLVLGVTEQQITKLTEMEADHEKHSTGDFERLLGERSRSQDPG